MSSEAKASAVIIGALPFVVGLLVYLTSPRYIELLWITETGQHRPGDLRGVMDGDRHIHHAER